MQKKSLREIGGRKGLQINSSFFSPGKELTKPFFFQPKLVIGPTDDVYEKEADAVADKIMRPETGDQIQTKISPVPIQRKCAACEEEELQRKDDGMNENQSEAPSIVSDVLGSGGSPLDKDSRSFMENRFGYDFSKVKIHTDQVAAKSAQSINALAYTSGSSIVFNKDQHKPETQAGKKLLAHELTHVVQQEKNIRRQEKQEGEMRTSFIYVAGEGSRKNDPNSMQGISDPETDQKLGDLYRADSVCWEGEYVGIELNFGTMPALDDVSSPRKIPPAISINMNYKEAGGFTSYRYQGSDTNPVWYSGERGLTSNWNPNLQTFFTYPLNRRGTLDIHLEMLDFEDDRLLIYDDKIDFVKCGAPEQGCRENAMATNRWAVLPDNGEPIHPLTGTSDDGERYEIYKEWEADNYFLCIDEQTKLPVDRVGNPTIELSKNFRR